jgi:hypothetical protein
VVLETVRKTLRLLTELGARIVGVLENIQRADSPAVKELTRHFDLPFLGSLPFDETLEEALGDVARAQRIFFKKSRAYANSEAKMCVVTRTGEAGRMTFTPASGFLW